MGETVEGLITPATKSLVGRGGSGTTRGFSARAAAARRCAATTVQRCADVTEGTLCGSCGYFRAVLAVSAAKEI